jgi:hypothetical protein
VIGAVPDGWGPPGRAGNDGRVTESVDASHPGAETQEPRLSRVERRHLAEARAKAYRRSRSPVRAWWIYPLAAALLACVYLGMQSAMVERPTEPTVVTSVPAAP